MMPRSAADSLRVSSTFVANPRNSETAVHANPRTAWPATRRADCVVLREAVSISRSCRGDESEAVRSVITSRSGGQASISMGHTSAVSVEYLFRVPLPSIPCANRFERGTTHGRARVRVAVQVLEPFGDGAGVSNWNDEAVLAVGDHIRAARVRGCNHRNPAGH